MTLDNKTIETLSVNAVKNSIVTSGFLDQFISENDKEPSWDGFVYIYNKKPKKKCNLEGRMAVQVKGVECDDHSKEEISFLVETVDLKNYLHDGGCILFVVYIGNAGITNKIYYIELTPIKLRQLLKEANNQNNKTVHLKPFPTDDNKKATIFLNCLQNCRKQASFHEGKLFSLEELRQQGVLEKIVIPFSGVGIKDHQAALINNEVYLYARIKGSNIPQPIDQILQNIHTQQLIAAMITIEDRIFYTKYSIIKSVNEVCFCIGNSIKITFYEREKLCKINYENSDKIRILAKDLDFMLEFLDKGYFKINEVKVPLNKGKVDFSNFNITKEKQHLAEAKEIVKVLDSLNCQDDLDINDMNNIDWIYLNCLTSGFIDRKTVKPLKEDLPLVCCIPVGKLRFIVYLKKCEGANEEIYEIYDFFKSELSFKLINEEGTELPIPQCHILNTNDFLTISNINFDILLPSYQKIERHPELLNSANNFLLAMLSAYDKASGTRKEKLLQTCNDFSIWLLEASDDELDYQTKMLNRLQIIKRSRDFNKEEIEKLYELIENSEMREESLVGAYLLLGQQQAAERHFAKLSEEEQTKFKEFPIYHFWKEM